MFRLFRNRRHSEEQVDELLSAYLDGVLTSDEQATLEARLEKEPALRERLDGLRLTVDALANLAQVETPRNFILSPAMVAAPRVVASPPRRRRAWPALSWAATAVTLLFLVVVASDLFVIAPSLRQEAADIGAQSPAEPRLGLNEREVPPPAGTLEKMEVVVEKEVLPVPTDDEAAAPDADWVPPAASEEAESEFAASVIEGDQVTVTEAPAPEEAPVAIEQPAEPQPTVRVEAEAPAPPPPSATAVTDELPESPPLVTGGEGQDVAESPADLEATATAGVASVSLPTVAPADEGRNDVVPHAPGEATATIPPVVIATPLGEAAPKAVSTDSAGEVPLWLRGIEVGLGLAAAALAAAALIARWRR